MPAAGAASIMPRTVSTSSGFELRAWLLNKRGSMASTAGSAPSRRTRSDRAARAARPSSVSASARVSREHECAHAIPVTPVQREGGVAAHRQPGEDGLVLGQMVQQRDRVVRDPLHRQQPVAAWRLAESACVEGDDAPRTPQGFDLRSPHPTVKGERVKQAECRAVA